MASSRYNNNVVPASTRDLIAWLDERFPRPLYEPDKSSHDSFLLETGKRLLVEWLRARWDRQNH